VSFLRYFYSKSEPCSLRIQHKGSGHGCRTVTLIIRFDRRLDLFLSTMHVRHLPLPRCVLDFRARTIQQIVQNHSLSGFA
jgi:hypothetical protein